MNKQNWDDIRFVLTVARLGSLNAASAKLGVTHATVMRRVAAFEANHGQKIFQKSQAGYKSLPEAIPILRNMENVEEATIAMERAIAGADQSPSGSVKIASTDSLCYFMLPEIVAKITEKFPKLRLTLLSANLHHDLSRLSADIVVRATKSLDDGLTGENVGKLSVGPYGNGTANLKWMRLDGVLASSMPAKWLTSLVSEEQFVDGSDSFPVLQQLAAHGVGKALLPDFVGDKDPNLQKLDEELPEFGVPIWVATLKEFAHVPRIVTVQKLLVKELKATGYFKP